MPERIYRLGVQGAWALLLFVLPLSSFPLVALIMGSTMVAPASGLVLLVLVLVWLGPYLLRRGTLPRQALPILGLALVALAGCLMAYFRPTPAFREISSPRSMLEALLTLAMGICFYLAAAAWPRERSRLLFSLRWLNWGGLCLIAWSLVQAGYWYADQSHPEWVIIVQSWLTSSKLFPGRVTGMALEPSWLAHQLNMAYLPFWLASSLTGFSAHRVRVWKLSFENFLLVGGVTVLVLSVSRVGLLAFLLMVAFFLLILALAGLRRVEARLLRNRPRRWTRGLFRLGVAAGLLVLFVLVFLAAGFGMSRLDPARMARIYDVSVLFRQSFVYYANQLVFAERVVFWEAGWNIFNDHPLMGVGLGNAGFYFPDKLSAFSWGLTEVRRLMYQWATLPNVKSLWVRLLAETGAAGLALFLSWCYVLWQSTSFLRAQAGSFMRMMGLAGAFVLVGLLIEGFSLDTLALPYYWVSLGLVTAACEFARCQPSARRTELKGTNDEQ